MSIEISICKRKNDKIEKILNKSQISFSMKTAAKQKLNKKVVQKGSTNYTSKILYQEQ